MKNQTPLICPSCGSALVKFHPVMSQMSPCAVHCGNRECKLFGETKYGETFEQAVGEFGRKAK